MAVLRTRRRPRANADNALHYDANNVRHVAPFDVAEQMRLLVAKSDLCAERRCVALTSTVPGEGTSFAARSLAAVVATDFPVTVALVEFSRATGNGPGAVAADSPRHPSQMMVGQTSIPNLVVNQTARVALAERSAFANSAFLRDGIAELRAQYDLVLLDLPAVTNDVSVLTLAELADQLFLVVRAGAAPADVVRRAVDDLQPSRIGSVILTGYKPPRLFSRLRGG